MTYTIGEFAKILGVTVDTLRTYEREGIVTPRKDALNNYRYYTDLDCRNILMSRWFRSLDLPLKEVTKLTTEYGLGRIRQSVTEKCESLRKEIEAQGRLLVRLEEIVEEIDALPEAEKRCVLVDKPGIYRIRQTRGNDLLVEEELKSTVSRWMELMPHSFFSLEVPLPETGARVGEPVHNWGLALPEADFDYFGLKKTGETEYIEPCRGVSTVIATSAEEPLTFEKLSPLLRYTEEKGFRTVGCFRGKLILTERSGRDRYRTFIEVMIPIQ